MKNIVKILSLSCVLMMAACAEDTQKELAAAFGSDITEALVGDDITFTDMTPGMPSRWDWTFEGGEPETSQLSSPKVKWMKPGTYAVKLRVSNKYSSSEIEKSAYVKIDYHSSVTADFEVEKTPLFDDEVVFIKNSSKGYPENVKWTLTPKEGDPVVITDYDINQKIPVGEYSVKLEISTPVASDSKEVADALTVLDRYAVIAAIGCDNSTTYEGGKVNFRDASAGNAQKWLWTFEGGEPATSTERNPVVTYSTAGSYKVVLKAYNDKYDSFDEKEGYVHVLPASELVFLLPFDGSVKDYGPNALGTSVVSKGGFELTYEAPRNNGGTSAKFPGGTKGQSYAVIAMPTALSTVYPDGSDFTLSVWTKLPGSISANNAIFAQGNCPGTTPVNQIWSRFQSGGVIRCTAEATGMSGNTATSKASDPTTFDDGSWHHVCIVYFKNNGKQDLRIYADGEKLVEANGKDDKGTLTLPYYIGCNLRLTNGEWAPENMFTGWMDDYVLYKKGFTAEEVKALYQLYN